MRSNRFPPAAVATTVALLAGALLWQAITTDSAAQDSTAREQAAPLAGGRQVWVEATFIQIDTVDLDKVRTESGRTLDPQSSTIILDGKEKAELIAALKVQPSFEIVGSASLITVSGLQAQMQMVEEVRYPSEYAAEAAERETGDGKITKIGSPLVVPKKIEAREVGIRLNVTPTISADGKSVGLVLLPEASFPAGWVNFGSKTFSQPVITSWRLTTSVHLRDGSTLVLTGVPTKNFEQSLLLSSQLGQKLKGTKSSVLLISAKIIPGEGDK